MFAKIKLIGIHQVLKILLHDLHALAIQQVPGNAWQPSAHLVPSILLGNLIK